MKSSFFICLFSCRFNFRFVSDSFHVFLFFKFFFFSLGREFALPSSGSGLAFLLGYCPTLTIRGDEKEEEYGSVTPKEGEEESSTTPKGEPHLGKGGMELTFLLGVGVALPSWSWGLPLLHGVGFGRPSWCWVAIASPFLGVGLIFLLGVGVGVVNVPSRVRRTPTRKKKEGQPKPQEERATGRHHPTEERGKNAKGEGKEQHHPKKEETKQHHPTEKGRKAGPPKRGKKGSTTRMERNATPPKGGEGRRRSCPPLGGVALSSSAWVVLPSFPWGGCCFHSFFGVVLFFPLPPLGGVPLPLWAVLL